MLGPVRDLDVLLDPARASWLALAALGPSGQLMMQPLWPQPNSAWPASCGRAGRNGVPSAAEMLQQSGDQPDS